MRSSEWLLGWWQAFAGSSDRLSILLARDETGNLVGLAPLYLQGAGGKGTFRLLGCADKCSHHIDWLTLPGWEVDVGRAFGQYLLACRAEWQRLLLESVDADAIALRATVDYLVDHGCLALPRPVNSSWKIALPESWEDYLAMLSRSLRKRCRKLQKDFFDSGKVKLRQVGVEAELQEGFDLLLKLHAARWGNPAQPLGVFSDRRFSSFLERVAGELLKQGRLRLAWLELDGRPLAVEYQFYDSTAVYAYQAGIDLTMDHCSPGKLTMMAAIRFGIERGCRYFDLLGGDEPYKANWRATPTACHDLRVWPRRGRGYLEWSLWAAYLRSAMILKQFIPGHVVERLMRLIESVKKTFR